MVRSPCWRPSNSETPGREGQIDRALLQETRLAFTLGGHYPTALTGALVRVAALLGHARLSSARARPRGLRRGQREAEQVSEKGPFSRPACSPPI
jgi:hypothetical protein